MHYYPFVVKLDRRIEICNTLNYLSNKVCIPNKTEDLNIRVFNIITGKNESKILTKDIVNVNHVNANVNLMEENVIHIKSGIMINLDVSVKNIIYVKKVIFGILLHIVVKMVNI